MKFTCVPESKGILLCDSAETEISCEAGWTMQLADVFWGRRYCTERESFKVSLLYTMNNYYINDFLMAVHSHFYGTYKEMIMYPAS